MKMRYKVITVTSNPEHAGLNVLKKSLEKFGWEYVVIVTQWGGFGTKLISTYNYIKANPDIDSFIFVDAHDVCVLSSPEEFFSKLPNSDSMLFGAERGCWPPPVQEFEHLYKKFEHGFNFVNSGVYYAPAKLFMEIFESAPPQYKSDDQWWASMLYLFGSWPIELDNNCDVFQCYSFIQEDDYAYGDTRVLNKRTGTMPIFFHANGNGGMPLIYDLAK